MSRKILKKSHSININFNDGNFMIDFPDGSTGSFIPLQTHWHSPSEHSVNGKLYDLEMHIVHLYEDGSLGAVLGIFFDREAGGNYDNDFIESVDWADATPGGTEITYVNMRTFLRSLDLDHYWSYDGSLTTPPCTEGIKWSVLE